MNQRPARVPARQIRSAYIERPPALIARAVEKAALHLLELFAADTRNKTTSAAYARAASTGPATGATKRSAPRKRRGSGIKDA